MIIFFENILFWKEFPACNGCFGLFTKIKKGSGTSFWCTFSVWFFHKNVSFLILCQWTQCQCHTFFPSQDIKQNVSLSSYLGICWRHKLQDISSKNLQSNGWQGEKEVKTETQEFEYLENKKSFLNEIKNILHSFWRAIIWWKMKIW